MGFEFKIDPPDEKNDKIAMLKTKIFRQELENAYREDCYTALIIGLALAYGEKGEDGKYRLTVESDLLEGGYCVEAKKDGEKTILTAWKGKKNEV